MGVTLAGLCPPDFKGELSDIPKNDEGKWLPEDRNQLYYLVWYTSSDKVKLSDMHGLFEPPSLSMFICQKLM